MAYSRTLNHFTSMQELATIWASSTSYVVNQLVIESDKLYRCLVAHTSGGTFIADLQAARWVEISASEAGVFNYIGNPDAEVDASGWTTYAESDSVTFTDAGDLVTLNNHGLSNGNEISFTSITSTTGISINTRYFVVSATTNTFQVASSSGGSALPLTTNGSGTMVRFVPKTGSGGSPNITWSRSIVSPLRGDADFNLVKDAANRQGQGVEYDFTIDNADLAKVLTVTFDYEVVSGTLATGDVTVYLIQDPSGTPLVIQPAGYQVQGATVGTKMRQIATFQTSSTVTSYRLCLHVSSVSATAYTLAVDNVVLGPQVVQYGAPVTDWQDYTPVVGWTGATTIQTAKWRRVGDSAEIFVRIAAGTSSGNARIGLPPGLVVANLSTTQVVGFAALGFNQAGSSTFLASSGNAFFQLGTQWSSGNGLTPDTAFAGQTFSGFAKIPILGWSSSVQMSNDTDTRVVAARYNNTAGQALTANVTNISWSTRDYDTHGSFDGTTFTAPVSGHYQIVGAVRFAASAVNSISAYVGGVQTARLSAYVTTAFSSLGGTVYLNAGQALTFRSDYSGTTAGPAPEHWISINRISGPSAIAASETVAARYINTAGSTLTTGAVANIPFATKAYDSHGAFNGTIFTVPVAGKYRISTALVTASVTLATSNAFEMNLVKNGSTMIAWSYVLGNGVSNGYSLQGATAIDCLAGDTLEVKARISVSTTLNTTANANYVCFERVGN